MRHPIKIWLASLLLVGITARPALAVSIDDLVNLKAKGISDAILVALIEADATIFHLSATDIISLKKRGLSDDVILAMINSAKPRPDTAPLRAAAPAPAAEPETAPRNDAEGYHDDYAGSSGAPSIHVHQSVTVEQSGSAAYPAYAGYPSLSYVPIAYYGIGMPNYLSRPAVPTNFVPTNIYWGFGGERRPDTWQPPLRRVQPSPVPTPHVALPPNTPLPKNTPLKRN